MLGKPNSLSDIFLWRKLSFATHKVQTPKAFQFSWKLTSLIIDSSLTIYLLPLHIKMTLQKDIWVFSFKWRKCHVHSFYLIIRKRSSLEEEKEKSRILTCFSNSKRQNPLISLCQISSSASFWLLSVSAHSVFTRLQPRSAEADKSKDLKKNPPNVPSVSVLS